jgi:hypothetical protein
MDLDGEYEYAICLRLVVVYSFEYSYFLWVAFMYDFGSSLFF